MNNKTIVVIEGANVNNVFVFGQDFKVVDLDLQEEKQCPICEGPIEISRGVIAIVEENVYVNEERVIDGHIFRSLDRIVQGKRLRNDFKIYRKCVFCGVDWNEITNEEIIAAVHKHE